MTTPDPTTTLKSPTTLHQSGFGRGMIGEGRRLWASRYVVREFVVTTLRVQYQQSVLGFLWSLLNPLLMLLVLAVVFDQLINRAPPGGSPPIPHYAVFLLCGVVPWQFFSAAINSGSMSLIARQDLIRKIGIHLLVFPASAVGVAMVNFVLALTAIFILMTFFGAQLTEHIVLVPLGILWLTIFTFGCVLIAMTLTTFYRDFQHIIGVVLQAGYFMTPIFYKPDMVPRIEPIINANPMTWMLAYFRHGLWENTWPDPITFWSAPAIALAALLIGYVVYKRNEAAFVFRL
jgi:ABC-type polysaccharide/polyol phosphate export permease